MDEEIEVNHEDNSLGFYVLPLGPHSQGAYKPSSQAQFQVMFAYHVNHMYFDIHSSDDIGTRRRTLIDQYQEKDEKAIEFKHPVFKNYDESYELLSDVVSSFGITRSCGNRVLHNLKWGRKIYPKKVFNKRPNVPGLYVYIGKDHAMYRCEECSMSTATKKSMAVSNKKVTVVRKKGNVSTADDKLESSCHDDVKEEGRKRKGRRNVSVSDDVKKEGTERKTRRRISDDVKYEGRGKKKGKLL